jgi:hypothetical protein
MQNTIFRKFKRSGVALLAGAAILTEPGCGTLTSQQEGALLVSAETLANIAGTAAATYYGGPTAGQAASAGLSALAAVLQGYVGTKIPATVVQATPGVAGVGTAVEGVVSQSQPVTQTDVNTVNQAAAIAAAH